MADTKISAMTAASLPLTGAELVPMVQGGSNVQTPISNVKKTFVSALQTTIGGFGVFQTAHGLGVVPQVVRAVLVCTSNDSSSGMTTGQEVSVECVLNSITGLLGGSLYADSTNVYWATSVFYSGSTSCGINKTDGSGPVAISVGNFSLKFYAVKL